jgi:hypothetical protein
MSAGIEQLFTNPEAEAFDTLDGDNPAPVLGADEEETARAFMRAFGVGATELLQDHRDLMVSADMPESLTQHHEAMVAAVGCRHRHQRRSACEHRRPVG